MVLPKSCVDDLKKLAAKKIIPSVSQGIRLAVEEFIAIQKKQEYVGLMGEASRDDAFIKRTQDAQSDFVIAEEGARTW